MQSPVILTSDLVSFCQGGVSIAIGSCESDGRPIVGLALGCRVEVRTRSVRLIVRRTANEALLQALEQGSGIAATFTQPNTHRSIQLKGTGAGIGAAGAEDRRSLAEQCAAFCRALASIGYSESFASTYTTYDAKDLATLSFTPTDAFLQTPGPGAGSPLT